MNADAVRQPFVDPEAVERVRAFAAPRRAIFLDRDGVINVDRGYVHTIEQTEWIGGIFDLVAGAWCAGAVPIVVTNQAGIARGLYDEATFMEFTAWMHGEFRRRGAPLLATYYCPHHPIEGLGPLKGSCCCRKPAPGMILRAIEEWAIDPAASLLIGDKESDIKAGKAARIGETHLIEPGSANLLTRLPAGRGDAS